MAITLNNGFKMPIIGLGVWRMDSKDIKNLLINAIKLGYRHFDCAGIDSQTKTVEQRRRLNSNACSWSVEEIGTKVGRVALCAVLKTVSALHRQQADYGDCLSRMKRPLR